jgi:hydroxymethylglutaryl-CoA synthase
MKVATVATQQDVARVGIDHIAVYTPAQYLDATELAIARGVDPKKYVEGIGISQIAVPPPDEDVVVLAANAGLKALREADVSPEDIGFLVIGTESAEDRSKPTATHVHELLGISRNCRVYDIIHACVGGTYGVLSALDWLSADSSRRYALVIASDIARYGRRTLGEPTQGAGAVALLLCRRPRLLELQELATFSRNVYDFWKPLAKAYPVVDGMFSAQCYTEAALACFNGRELSPRAAYLYHTPYPKLVQQTHSRIARLFGSNVEWKSHYDTHVAPSHTGVARIGNTYTASLWFALYGLIEATAKGGEGRDVRESFDGCYLFSYGSGCGAAVLRGTFGDACAERTRLVSLTPELNQRRKLSLEEYEALMVGYEAGVSEGDLAIGATGAFRLIRVEHDKRIYGQTSIASVPERPRIRRSTEASS